jgi:flagellar protein FlgJ
VTNPAPASPIAFMPTLNRGSLTELASNAQAARARVPELMAVCQCFEAVFLSQLFRVMRLSEPKDKLFGGGMAEGIYREMLDDQYASQMATTGGTGIAEMLYNQLEAAALPAKNRLHDSGRDGTDTGPTFVMEAADDVTTRRMAP